VVSPWDENVTILAFMFGLLRDVHLQSSVELQSAGFAVPCVDIAPFPHLVNTQNIPGPYSQNQTDMKNPKAGGMPAARHSRSSALLRRGGEKCGPLLFDFRAGALWAFHLTLLMFRKSQND
jgi:hypothetical protein